MTRRWAVWRITRERREVDSEAGGTSVQPCEVERRIHCTIEALTITEARVEAEKLYSDYALLDRLDVRELLRLPGT